MFRRLVGLAGGLLLLSTSWATAQDSILGQMYGAGVHAFYSNDFYRAYEQFSAAVDGGSQDPRCYYYRGLCLIRLGRAEEAQKDFETGAKLETADVNRFYNVPAALQRIQGNDRLTVEQYRTQARMKAFERQRELRAARYGEQRQAEQRVLEQQAAAAPATPSATMAQPATVGGFQTGPIEEPKPAAPATPAPAAPAVAEEKPADTAPAMSNPFAAPAAPAPTADDPFGAPAATAPAAAPATTPASAPTADDPFGAPAVTAPAAKPAAAPAADDPFGAKPAEEAVEAKADEGMANEAKPAADSEEPSGEAAKKPAAFSADPFGEAAKPAKAEEKPAAADDPFGGMGAPAATDSPAAEAAPAGGQMEDAPTEKAEEKAEEKTDEKKADAVPADPFAQ